MDGLIREKLSMLNFLVLQYLTEEWVDFVHIWYIKQVPGVALKSFNYVFTCITEHFQSPFSLFKWKHKGGFRSMETESTRIVALPGRKFVLIW